MDLKHVKNTCIYVDKRKNKLKNVKTNVEC